MKTPLFYLTFLLFTSTLFAQIGINQLWQKEFSNNAGKEILELEAVTTSANGTVVVGFSTVQEGVVLYIAKYQSNGQLSWETKIPTSQYSSLNYIIEDSQGNLYVAGSETIGNFNQRQVVLAKLDGSGQVQWKKTYKGPTNLFAGTNDLKLMGGNLYMCGTEEGTNGYDIAWIAKYDVSGNQIWEKSFDPGTETAFSNLTIDNAGAVTAVGYADFGDSFLAIQYDTNGSLKWQYPATLTGVIEQFLTDVVADNNGNVYVVGTEESGSFEDDIVTLKLDNTGSLAWQKNFNNGSENSGSAIRIAPNGNIYSMGNKEDSFDEFALITAYDSTGMKLWETDFTIDDNTYIVDTKVDASGDIYLGIQDYDSFGVVKFSSAGMLLARKIYGTDRADYLSSIAISGNEVVGTAYLNARYATLFSLQPSTLSDNYLVESNGIALSDARPGALVSDGSYEWLSTYSDDGDSAIFSIIKLDLSGNVMWEKGQQYASSIPSFPYLSHDGSGNIYGLFQNGITVSAAYLGLVKYDATGTEQFTIYLDSADVYNAGGLAVDNSENVYITGYNQGTRRMFLSQYNSSGILQWTKDYLSPSPTFPFAKPWEMQFSAQGKLVIPATHRDANDNSELHLFQYATDGTLEWHKDVAKQSGSLTAFSGMTVASNGDIYIFGSSGTGNYVAAKFDKTGNILWDEKGPTASTQAPRSMAVDGMGRMHLCFSSSSNLYVRQLSAAGALVTDKQISTGSSGAFYFPWQCRFANGQLAILGEHLMPIGGVPFQMLLDNQLDPVYIQIDSTRNGKIQAMAIDPNGDLYGAYLSGDLSLGDGFRSALVRKFVIGTVGIDEELENAKALTVYPNPSQGPFHVDIDSKHSAEYSFDLFDLQGKKVSGLGEKRVATGLSTLSFQIPAHLGNGTYLLGVESEKGIAFRKVVVLR